MIAPYSVSQILQGAQLKLFDGSFATPELLRDLPYASLVDKAPDDHLTLIWRKALDELKKNGALFNLVVGCELLQNSSRHILLLGEPLPPIGKDIAGDSHKPCDKRNAAPLKVCDAGKGLMKYFRR